MTQIIEWFLQTDRTVFHWVNSGWSNVVFDQVLPWCRTPLFWAPFYLFILVFMGINSSGRQRILFIGGLLLAVSISDFTSSTLIKKQVGRIRPCNDPAMTSVIARVSCGSGYSFTSNHAANHFTVAVFLIGILGPLRRWIKPVLLGWASLVALSQVYVGVHYPLDVIAGAFLGIGIGAGCAGIVKRWGGSLNLG
jgi:membrane-associated phospholipid phosphatase